MSSLPLNGQPKSTQDSNYITETLLGMYDVEELPNLTFPLKFTTIAYSQWEDLGIKPN